MTRDRLSVRFDGASRRILLAAAQAARQHPPRGVVTYVPSPRGEYSHVDAGGRTRTERAFTRSVYYLVMKVPPRRWSLKLSWGPVSRRGRRCELRLFTASAGYAYAARGRLYTADETFRSTPAHRIDDLPA